MSIYTTDSNGNKVRIYPAPRGSEEVVAENPEPEAAEVDSEEPTEETKPAPRRGRAAKTTEDTTPDEETGTPQE